MQMKKPGSENGWVDPDDAPPLAKAWFETAELRMGDRVVRPGRPKAANAKRLVSLRLDADVLAHFRASGPGWQSRINAALRKVAGV